jgi:curved DNA-binding protein CbpA
MTTVDHYAVLGVLPHAEAIVVTAAYRALAQRYHPDKWQGDPAQAHERMAAINEAYRVLGNEQLRQTYDAERKTPSHASYEENASDEMDGAFDAALCELEDRWSVAVSIFPDLTDIRSALARISSSLAFAFVTVLLDTRNFNGRAALAKGLEKQFLSRYFGTNEVVLTYARELISAGHRSAAKMLNGLVDVMGSGVEPSLLIDQVEKRYAVGNRQRALESLIAKYKQWHLYEDAYQLALLRGYKVKEERSGFLGSKLAITVTSSTGSVLVFDALDSNFHEWVQATLC